MHINSMPEDAGEFNTVATRRVCPVCRSPMKCEQWDSSDGAYEDFKYSCSNNDCRHTYWIDGIDS